MTNLCVSPNIVEKPAGFLSFHADSLIHYAKTVEWHYGLVVALREHLVVQPIYYDGEEKIFFKLEFMKYFNC